MSHVMDESSQIEVSNLSKLSKPKASLANSKVNNSNSLFYNRQSLDSDSEDDDSGSDSDDFCAVNLDEVLNKKVKIKSTQ